MNRPGGDGGGHTRTEAEEETVCFSLFDVNKARRARSILLQIIVHSLQSVRPGVSDDDVHFATNPEAVNAI